MGKSKRVIAVVGTYRKRGVIDSAVEEILSSAQEQGAEVSRIYLTDARIEFCTNCRACTRQEGRSRGRCPLPDDMEHILESIEQADAVVLASPVNFGTVTAVMKRFIERLVCYAYWPWGAAVPKIRTKETPRKAVVVVSSAAPAFLARIGSRAAVLLRQAAGLLGASTTGVLFIGMAARREHQGIGSGVRKKARRLGRKLADA
ncbi:MAG: flavodoxin family protein [Desulfomonilia bacterium]